MEVEFHYSKNIRLHLNYSQLIKRFERIAFFEKFNLGAINYIFVGDRELLILNKKYLHHTYPTDIITFDYSNEFEVSGDIYISIDTVKYNAKKFKVLFPDELHRVMIHGLLHLLKYKDKTEHEKRTMRAKENYYLQLV